jgi:hypothetical protein
MGVQPPLAADMCWPVPDTVTGPCCPRHAEAMPGVPRLARHRAPPLPSSVGAPGPGSNFLAVPL